MTMYLLDEFLFQNLPLPRLNALQVSFFVERSPVLEFAIFSERIVRYLSNWRWNTRRWANYIQRSPLLFSIHLIILNFPLSKALRCSFWSWSDRRLLSKNNISKNWQKICKINKYFFRVKIRYWSTCFSFRLPDRCNNSLEHNHRWFHFVNYYFDRHLSNFLRNKQVLMIDSSSRPSDNFERSLSMNFVSYYSLWVWILN